jgi:hypothetical protein
MPRSENATRVSNVADMGHMKRVITEWIWDRVSKNFFAFIENN